MTDAALLWYDFGADITVENGDLFPDNGLASAVLISLFTDARAPSEDSLPGGENSKRGWWGDMNQRSTGSLLWLIQREKTLQEVAARAKEYSENSLDWMLEQGIAGTIAVEATIIKPQSLQIKIRISRGNSKQYSYLWAEVAKYAEVKVQNTTVIIEFE